MLENNNYSALPAGDTANLLAEKYRALLQTNLLGYLISVQTALKFDLSGIIEKYQQLDFSRKLSPAIYNLFSKLISATTDGNITPIIDVLHRLRLLDNNEIYKSDFQISTILTESWERDFIDKLRSEHIPNKNNDITLILPILSPDLSYYEAVFRYLKEQIKIVDIDFHKEIEAYVTRLKLFNGKGLKAATSASVFGAIYLKLPTQNEKIETYLAEHIIHETSHLQLDILLAFDKIVLNEDTEKFPAPIRVDNRPMFGIFHATFVLSRMIRLFKKFMLHTPHSFYVERLDVFRKQFEQGLATIEKNAVLTEKGQLIKNSFISVSEN